MQALYLSPATADNLAASIENPVPLERVKEHFGQKYHDELIDRLEVREGVPEDVYCWSMSSADGRAMPSGYEKMQEGDIVLLKRTGTPVTNTFDYLGQVIYKKPCREFGEEVWPHGGDCRFVYFFTSINRVHIDKGKLFAAIGYVPTGPLPAQLRVAQDKLEGIYNRYGSLDAFLGVLQSDAPIHAIVVDEGGDEEPDLETPGDPVGECPDWLATVIEEVSKLLGRRERKAKDHNILVGKFYEACGFKNVDAIRYQAGNIDVSIERDGVPFIVNIVKRDKNLSYRQSRIRRQAYNYALENGAPIVVVTNGDYYAFLDRRKGLKWTQHLERELTLSRLTPEDVLFLESCPWLKPPE